MIRAGAPALLILSMLAAGCSGSATSTTAPTTTVVPIGAESPEAAVTGWLDAMRRGDIDAVSDLVRQDQLILLIAVDNVLDGRQIAQAIRSGVGDGVADAYWQSFSASFEDFAGAPIEDLEARDVAPFMINDEQFAAVEIAYLTRIGSTEIVAAEVSAGRWQVDLLATIGPSLVRPFRDILAAVPAGDDGDLILAELERAVPSLRAALERPAAADLPVDFILETESFIRLVTSGG